MAEEHDCILLESDMREVKDIILNETKVCTGCGWLDSDPIHSPALACCPDNNYIPLRKYLARNIYRPLL
jgi:hypothetical protein